jgi:hypothetical protein
MAEGYIAGGKEPAMAQAVGGGPGTNGGPASDEPGGEQTGGGPLNGGSARDGARANGGRTDGKRAADGHAGDGPARPLAEQSTAELVQHATEQLSLLVREELQLARVELAEKGRNAGIGVGLFGGAGVFTVYGTGVLVAAAVLGLAQVLAGWLSALIIGGALILLAGLMALIGKRRVQRAVPPVPQDAVRSVRKDIDAVTAAVRERGRP